MKIALVQMRVDSNNPKENERHAFALLEEGAKNAQVLVLPEMWTVGYNFRTIEKEIICPHHPLLERLKEFSKEKKVTVISGSLPFKGQEKLVNRTVVFGPDGTALAQYDKLHIFSMYREPQYFEGGQAMVTFPLKENIQAGLSICYDLRFPELYRAMALQGADIFFVPALWPATRGLSWKVLATARAIENQVYICAVNAVGRYRDTRFFGHSLFIGPDGTILQEGFLDEEILYADFRPAVLQSTRAHMGVWQDRRTDIYGS